MIPKSFSSEIEKIAFIASIGKFLAQNVPSMLSSVRGATVTKAVFGAQGAGVGRARMMGGLIGGASGGFAGAQTGEDQATKSRNTMLGAVAGGLAGAVGFGKLAPKVQNLGVTSGADLKALGKYMQSRHATDTGKVIDYAAKKFTPKFQAVGKNAPTSKSFFGIGPETKAVGVQKTKPSMVGGALGELAQSAKTVKDAPNVFTGAARVLKQNWEHSKFYTKDIGGKTYKFQRSGIGRIVNPALSSGVGFGALEAATMTNEDGSKPTVSKRLLRGGTTALAWGAAPKLMFGKTLAYDIPKTLIGMKQQTELPRQ